MSNLPELSTSPTGSGRRTVPHNEYELEGRGPLNASADYSLPSPHSPTTSHPSVQHRDSAANGPSLVEQSPGASAQSQADGYFHQPGPANPQSPSGIPGGLTMGAHPQPNPDLPTVPGTQQGLPPGADLQIQINKLTDQVRVLQDDLDSRDDRVRVLQGDLDGQDDQVRKIQGDLEGRDRDLAVQRELSGEQNEKHRRAKWWFCGIICATVVTFITTAVTLGVLYGTCHNCRIPPPIPTLNLTVFPSTYAENPPISDSHIGVSAITFNRNDFAPLTPSDPITFLVYYASNSTLCTRVKSSSQWRSNVQCISGANPLPNSPIILLDWLGGPSIYFFNTSHVLSGLDHVPRNDTWRPSIVADQGYVAHNKSQIASLAWLNGTATWIYLQDPNGKVREYGMDTYRDISWREGSAGPLGDAPPGSGIAATRYLNGTAEVEGVFFQQRNSALSGRTYVEDAWMPDQYAVEGTLGNVADGSSLCIATIADPNPSNSTTSTQTLLLAYMSKSGFLSVQTRSTLEEKLGAFSGRVQVVEGDGVVGAGVGCVGLGGKPWVYVVSGRKVIEGTSEKVEGGNWTTSTI